MGHATHRQHIFCMQLCRTAETGVIYDRSRAIVSAHSIQHIGKRPGRRRRSRRDRNGWQRRTSTGQLVGTTTHAGRECKDRKNRRQNRFHISLHKRNMNDTGDLEVPSNAIAAGAIKRRQLAEGAMRWRLFALSEGYPLALSIQAFQGGWRLRSSSV